MKTQSRRAAWLLAAIAILGAATGAPPAAKDAAPGPVTLQYLGHSCFVVTSPSGLRVLIDPFAANEWPGLRFPYVHADRVVISHPHWDHAARGGVRGDPKVIEEPGEVRVKDVLVRGITGRHAPVGGDSIGYANTIHVIETGGLKLCHLGDNEPLPEDAAAALPAAIGPVDVLMIPIDAERRVLTYEQAEAWILALAPRIVIPMHYRVPGLSLTQISGIGTLDEWLSQLSPRRGAAILPSDTLSLDPATLPAAGAGQVRVLTLPGQRPFRPEAAVASRAEMIEAVRLGDLAVAEGDLATALAQYTRAAAMNDADAGVLQKLGFLHLGAGRPDRAVEYLERGARAAAATDAKTASLCWLGAGMALDLLGRRDEALAAYRAVVETGLNDEAQTDQARRYLESPYRED
ncbi:MAG TPA: MBL fold metallo-hydrolase [Candidatus Polarisedimenticolia bacterium]|nr:MBL fold metallo-hydrolase [Candidatus Polarisedimenticolia bacterium]